MADTDGTVRGGYTLAEENYSHPEGKHGKGTTELPAGTAVPGNWAQAGGIRGTEEGDPCQPAIRDEPERPRTAVGNDREHTGPQDDKQTAAYGKEREEQGLHRPDLSGHRQHIPEQRGFPELCLRMGEGSAGRKEWGGKGNFAAAPGHAVLGTGGLQGGGTLLQGVPFYPGQGEG